MESVNLTLNDERWCTECGNFVSPTAEVDVNEMGEEIVFIVCPECGRSFRRL